MTSRCASRAVVILSVAKDLLFQPGDKQVLRFAQDDTRSGRRSSFLVPRFARRS